MYPAGVARQALLSRDSSQSSQGPGLGIGENWQAGHSASGRYNGGTVRTPQGRSQSAGEEEG